jgi:ribosomal protein S18 acetylase RimI-like enzyme
MSPGFDLHLAFDQDTGEAVGQILGYVLPPGARWRQGLTTPVPDGFTDEDGARTFAISEIMVHPEYRRRGIARTLHDRLLAARPERRATLLVDPDNTPVRTAYAHWGWTDVARLLPYPDAPHFHALVIPLPVVVPPA